MRAGHWCVTLSRTARTVIGIGSARSRRCQSGCAPSWRRSMGCRACSMASMLEAAAAVCAGLGVVTAILAVAVPAPSVPDDAARVSWWRRYLRQGLAEENALGASAGFGPHSARSLVLMQVLLALAGGLAAALLTGLPALAAVGAIGSVALVRGAISSRARARQVVRQVAVLVAFLVVLSALHSPYLDAYHTPIGQAFLLAMLGVMGSAYLWMKQLLLLPGLQRVRLSDA